MCELYYQWTMIPIIFLNLKIALLVYHRWLLQENCINEIKFYKEKSD